MFVKLQTTSGTSIYIEISGKLHLIHLPPWLSTLLATYQEVNSRAVRSLSVQGATGWEGVDMKPADEQTC